MKTKCEMRDKSEFLLLQRYIYNYISIKLIFNLFHLLKSKKRLQIQNWRQGIRIENMYGSLNNSDSDMSDDGENKSVCSDTDLRVLNEARIAQLTDENLALTKQLDQMKAQFEQAVTFVKKFEESHLEIEKLKEDLRNMTSQKEDIERRLEISNKSLQETQKKLNEEKKIHEMTRAEGVELMQKELTKAKKNCNVKIQELCSRIEAINAEREQLELDNKHICGKLSFILKSSSRFFDKDISDIEQLCEHFESQPCTLKDIINSIPKVPPLTPAVPLQQDVDLVEKLNSTKSKYKKYKDINKSLVSENEELKQNMESNRLAYLETENHYKHEVQLLKSELEKVHKDRTNIENTMNSKVVSLQARIDSLSKQNTDLIKKIQIPEKPTSVESPKSAFTAQLEALKEENDELLRRSNELNTNYIQANAKFLETEKALTNLTRKYTELEQCHDKLCNEINTLRIVECEHNKEIETLRTALYGRENHDTAKAKQKFKMIQKLKADSMRHEQIAESMKKQLYEINLENASLKQELSAEVQRVKELDKVIENIKDQNNQLRDSVIDAERRCAERIHTNDQDSLPISVWNVSFDPELNKKISNIGSTANLLASTKVQAAFKAIAKFYSKRAEKAKSELLAFIEREEGFKQFINDFIVNLSIAIDGTPVTIDELKHVHKLLIKKIQNFRNHLSDDGRKLVSYQCAIQSLADLFGYPVAEFESMPQRIFSEVQRLNQDLNRLRDKKRTLKEQNSLLNADIKKIKSEHISSSASTNTKAALLLKENEDLHSENLRLKDEINQAKISIKDVENNLALNDQQNKALIQQIELDNEAHINNLQKRFNKLCEDLTHERDDALSKVDSLSNQVASLKQALEACRQSFTEKSKAFDDLKDFKERREEELTRLLENQRTEIDHSHEKAIQELTQQCNKHREDVVRLSEEVSAKDCKIKELKQSVLNSKRAIAKNEKDSKLAVEELKRENKLLDSQSRNQILEMEAQMNSEVSKVKARSDGRIRRLIGFAADEFKHYFNPSDSLDENSYKFLISRVKQELERATRVESNVRRLVSASAGQSTDDAVAQYLMRNNN